MKGITEPRLYTKELRPLTEETTLGFACIEYAETVLRKTLYPWQNWALVHALEIVGDLETGWHFRYVALDVPIGSSIVKRGKTIVNMPGNPADLLF